MYTVVQCRNVPGVANGWVIVSDQGEVFAATTHKRVVLVSLTNLLSHLERQRTPRQRFMADLRYAFRAVCLVGGTWTVVYLLSVLIEAH